jgi:hypothetical protein
MCKISATSNLSYYHHVLWTWCESTNAQLPPASLARRINGASTSRGRLARSQHQLITPEKALCCQCVHGAGSKEMEVVGGLGLQRGQDETAMLVFSGSERRF